MFMCIESEYRIKKVYRNHKKSCKQCHLQNSSKISNTYYDSVPYLQANSNNNVATCNIIIAITCKFHQNYLYIFQEKCIRMIYPIEK